MAINTYLDYLAKERASAAIPAATWAVPANASYVPPTPVPQRRERERLPAPTFSIPLSGIGSYVPAAPASSMSSNAPRPVSISTPLAPISSPYPPAPASTIASDPNSAENRRGMTLLPGVEDQYNYVGLPQPPGPPQPVATSRDTSYDQRPLPTEEQPSGQYYRPPAPPPTQLVNIPGGQPIYSTVDGRTVRTGTANPAIPSGWGGISGLGREGVTNNKPGWLTDDVLELIERGRYAQKALSQFYTRTGGQLPPKGWNWENELYGSPGGGGESVFGTSYGGRGGRGGGGGSGGGYSSSGYPSSGDYAPSGSPSWWAQVMGLGTWDIRR